MGFLRGFHCQILAALGLSAACLLHAGCGKKGIDLQPVRGQVLFEGQPAEGVQVVFQPTSEMNGREKLISSGKTGADGSFTLTTYPDGEGAPVGDYIVLASWYPSNAREVENARNKLPAKYANAAEPVLKATVKIGENQLEPFRLTK